MKVAIVYESIFGNTRTVAEAIAEGFGGSWPDIDVAVVEVNAAPADLVTGVDLLVVGGPTHIFRMSTPGTRRMGLRSAIEKFEDGGAMGVREWLRGLSAVQSGQKATAFDTRLSSLLAGGAARSIVRRLKGCGYQIVTDPQGFLVESNQGPLKRGEQKCARLWGVRLARLCWPEWVNEAPGVRETQHSKSTGGGHGRNF
jgi:hypothetical protein